MNYEATNPERVFDKARECKYFLARMADHESALDTEKFLFCLSAFLSAFRTAIFRLYGVVQSQQGRTACRALMNGLRDTDVGFLKDATDLEVHGDGVTVRQRYTVHTIPVPDSVPERWRSRFDKDPFGSRFDSPFRKVPADPQAMARRSQAVDWQLEERPRKLIALCHDALNHLEETIRRAIVPASSADHRP